MYWIHGQTQFTNDELPKTYVLYGPFFSKLVTHRALIHIKDTIIRNGGLSLKYLISRKKSS